MSRSKPTKKLSNSALFYDTSHQDNFGPSQSVYSTRGYDYQTAGPYMAPIDDGSGFGSGNGNVSSFGGGHINQGGYNQGYSQSAAAPSISGFENIVQGFPAQHFLNNPMVADFAVRAGSDFVQQNIAKHVATSRIKYYFAVDNAYVGKKLLLLLFPYSQSNWSVKYDQQEQVAVAPRYDINAPDIYIPVMAFVTFLLTAGVALGIQNKFSPEQLGLLSSSVLGWLVVELLVLCVTLYVLSIDTSLRYLDLVAYAGYKYVGMIIIVVAGLIFRSTGYYFALLWCSCSLAFFLIRTLKLQILPYRAQPSDGLNHHGSKRRLYILLFIAAIQPVFMWWLTRSLCQS